MPEVTDPALIAQLDAAEKASSGKEVTDPDLIAKLDAAEKQPASQNTFQELSDPNNWGRALALAGRAVLEAPAQLASLPADAATEVINFAKNPYKPAMNPLTKEFWHEPNRPGDLKTAGNTIHEAYTAAGFPEPRNMGEKVAYGVESVLAGAKVPAGPRAIPAAAEAAAGRAPNTLESIGKGLSKPSEETLKTNAARRVQAKQAKDAKKATAAIEKALANQKKDIATESTKVKEAQEQGVPLTLADSVPNTGEVLAQHPRGGASKIMEESRLGSLKDEKRRVPGEVRAATGTEDDYGLFTQGLANTRSASARANYEAVRQDATPVTDPQIWKILENPLVAKLYQEARNQHMEERSLSTLAGNPSPELADIYAPKPRTGLPETGGREFLPNPANPSGVEWVRTGTAPDVKSLDYLIRNIDEKITELYKSGVTGGTAKNLKTVRNMLKGRLETVSPAYQRASNTYALDSEIMDARELGNKGFMDMTPGAAAQAVGRMNGAQKNALRMGVVEKLLKAAEKSGKNRNIANEVLGGDRQQKVLRAMFDNDRDFDSFKRVLELEDKIHQNTMKMTGGSPTFRRMAAAEDFSEEHPAEKVGAIATIANLFEKGWRGTGLKLLFKMMIDREAWNAGKAEMAARILTSKDPEATIKRLQRLSEMSLPNKNPGKSLGAAKGAQTLRGDQKQDSYPSTLRPEVTTRVGSSGPWTAADGSQWPDNP